jgi:flagellar biosynthesis/type III secretory pathway M-ring protein FliF/YscJ
MVVFTALKAGKREKLPTAEELVGVPPALAGESDVIGEAVEADSVLQGIELSDDEMKSRKMMEQVEDMVKEKPEDAARLLGRWITGT